MANHLIPIVAEICESEGYDLALSSKDWVMTISRGGEHHFIHGYKFDLNPAAATLIANDKFATYEILRQFNVPVIEHALLYAVDNEQDYAENCKSPAYISQYLAAHRNHIVIKPNDGNQGVNVFQVQNMAEAQAATSEIFRRSYSASMCPFYDILHEYRFVMLAAEPRLAYAKSRSDDWRFNLSQGSAASKITDSELYAKLEKIARAAVAAIGLRFCSVDIIETTDHELLVMEINSGVTIRKYLDFVPEDRELVREIYRDAINLMFAHDS